MDPSVGWAHSQLGRIYRKQRRWPEAGAEVHKALELEPQDSNAHVELGALYRDQFRFAEAAAEFKKALAKDRNNSRAHCQLGRIYRRQGRWPEAEAAFKAALAINPINDWACVELGVLYKDQDRFPAAEAACHKAITIAPQNGAAHFQLGNIYRRQGRWREAEQEFKKTIAIDSENDRAYMGLWAIYRSQGRTAEAEAAARKASAMNPGNAWACAGAPKRLDPEKAAGKGTDRLGSCASADGFVAQGRSMPAGMIGTRASGSRGDGPADATQEQVFCMLPWTYLHVRADGSSRPCCMWSGSPLANARSAPLAGLWNSPVMKALRADMMNGRPVAGCERCYEDERSGFWSMRQRNLVEWDRHRSRIGLTAPDGTLPPRPVPSVDIRFSNVCNLRCRTCDPTQSSAWAADAQALGSPVEGGAIQKPYADWDSLWRQLQPLLEEGLEEMVFFGGEPLIMEEHYRILDFLIARGFTSVRLRYNTNFSTLRFQGRDVIDLWSRFRDVRVIASLDGSGRRGEYLRKGLCWDAAVANREEMLRRCPEVVFSISATLSIFNALHLPDFHREWGEKGYIDRDEFALNMLVAPEIYRAQALPPALKQRVLEAYRRHQETFLDADGSAAHDFAAAAHFIAAQDRSEQLPGFVAMTRRLDQLRGEDCREVFPELAALFEAAE